jgi:hypothetical protein
VVVELFAILQFSTKSNLQNMLSLLKGPSDALYIYIEKSQIFVDAFAKNSCFFYDFLSMLKAYTFR